MNTEYVDTDERVRELAGEAYGWFQTVKRGEDDIVTLKDDRPDWVRDLVCEAHGGDFLPDDWRYECIRAALGFVHDVGSDDLDDSHEFADGHVDVYTHARLQWLASDLNRPSYVDEGVSELGGEGLDEVERIGLGQYMEAREVYGAVLSTLREIADGEED